MTRILHFAVQFVVVGLAVAFVVIWLWPQLLPAWRQNAAPSPTSYADAVNRTAPSVVSVYTRTMVTEPLGAEIDDPLFQAIWRDRMITRPRRGLGSGVIISSDGLILTTRHVISGVDDILVALWDGRVAEASVVGSDPGTDIALLRIDLDELPVATLAEGGSTRAGDVVLAIGNAFGLSHTVTMGIVSATGRGHLSLPSYEDFIQTDAAINAGNSGGALINAAGEVVGINSASMGQETGAQGISFAIPASVVRRIAEELIAHGEVTRSWMGVELADVSLRMSDGDPPQTGARVVHIYQGSPGWAAGLEVGDIIVRADQQPVASARRLKQRIAGIEPGTTVRLELIRSNQMFQARVQLAERPEDAAG
jgi:S1-C subfamily serine protease